MIMSRVTKDYTGRKVDLNILQAESENSLSGVTLSFFGGEITSGPLATAQKVLIALLTERGSVPSSPDYGTLFLQKLLSGQIPNRTILRQEFAIAAYAVIGYFRRVEGDLPDDEKIADITLDSFNLVGDDVYLRIRVTTNALENRTIILPVNIPITS